jgi:hypothetical protein
MQKHSNRDKRRQEWKNFAAQPAGARLGPDTLLSDFFKYLFYLNFRKINGRQKNSRNVHLASYPTAVGVPVAVEHNIRSGANGRLYCPVGLDSCHRGARRQKS